MQSLIILLIPILMFLDYYLTLWGALLRMQKFGNHITTPSYELNPIFRRAISQFQIFNVQHAIYILVITSILLILNQFGMLNTSIGTALIGFFVITYATINARHIANILTFLYARKNPDSMSGIVVLSEGMSIAMSMDTLVLSLVPLVFVTIATRSPFALGGTLGIILLIAQHAYWHNKLKGI